MSDTLHPKAQMLADAYADMRKFDDYLADDIVVHAQGTQGIATGDWRGKETVINRMAELWARSGESYVMTTHDITANDAFACVLARLEANHPTNGRSMDVQICGVWRFDGEGKLAEHWENCDDWSQFDAFFAQD